MVFEVQNLSSPSLPFLRFKKVYITQMFLSFTYNNILRVSKSLCFINILCKLSGISIILCPARLKQELFPHSTQVSCSLQLNFLQQILDQERYVLHGYNIMNISNRQITHHTKTMILNKLILELICYAYSLSVKSLI